MRLLFLAVLAALAFASPAAAAPSWLAPVDLGAETAATSSIGRVGLGADGTAVAAWAQFNGASWDLQVARRKPGEGFGGVITVPGTGGVSGVRVGVDSAGNATILFVLGDSVVVLPWPSAAAAPGALQTVGTGDSGELAVGRTGTAVATWIDDGNPLAPQVRAAVRAAASGDFGPSDAISQLGNGNLSITGLDVAVGDGGHATAVWSRNNGAQTFVEANERVPGGNFFSGSATFTSTTSPANEPAVAVDAAGRSTVLWTRSNQIMYTENTPGGTWSTEQRVSTSGDAESQPSVGAAPGGTVVAAWQSNGAIITAARAAGGGAFANFQPISGPAMNAQLPVVVVGGNGDALISWQLGDGKAIPTVQRAANGAFGPVLTAVNASNPAPGENLSFSQPSIGIDDEGNGAAAWTRASNRGGTDFYKLQAASFDAAAPSLTSSVPPGGAVGAPIGMAATTFDRVSPVGIAWAFGDGGSATGGAVSHAFGTGGAFNVTVTATDAAGNATSATHPVLITANPVKKKRIRSKPIVSWGVTKSRIYLVRMRVPKVPKKTKAVVTCKGGKKCAFKRVSSKKRRKGTITLFKGVKTSKLVGKKRRTFRPGARVELRITAPGYIGKVVRYKLKRAKVPVGRTLCLPVGAKKPRKRCP